MDLQRGSDDPWILFERLSIVGKGGFGVAILCRRKNDRKLVVIKEIDMNSMSGPERKNAVKEADLLSILNHPNIVTYYGSYTVEGSLLIEMEFCPGGSLSPFLCRLKDAGQSLLEEDVLVLFRQVMCALSYLDEKNILHRDLKTGNIFMSDQSVCCTIKVGDFGIAKVLSTERPNASTVCGTPDNFSPEVCAGKRYTKKADIWAAGCVLYELTCLHKTFEGSSLPVIINKIVRGSFAPIRGSYSNGLRKLISELLQKDPDLRPRPNEVIVTVDHLLFDCSVKRLRTMKPELQISRIGSETLFAEQFMSSMARKMPKRSLIFQLKVSPSVHLEVPIPVPPCQVCQISRSSTQTLLLTKDCFVYSGCTNRPLKRIESLVGKNIIKVRAGKNFSLFLNERGLLLVTGDPQSSCLGKDPSQSDYIHDPEVIDSLLGVDVVDFDCSSDHVIVVSREGDAYSWGHNRNGCLGVGDMCVSPIYSPTPVILPEGISLRKVFCGKSSTAFVDSKDHLWVCGSNSCRRLGLNSPDDKSIPTKLPWIKEMGAISSVDLGEYATSIVFEDGGFLILGRKFGLQHTVSPLRPLSALMPASFPTKLNLDSPVTRICCGNQFFMALTKESTIYFWGQRQKHSRRSESILLSRTKSFVQEVLSWEDIVIGESEEPLMDIVSRVGPDHPVILMKEPKVKLNDFRDLQMLRSREEVISTPNLILALYSSQVHLKYGETISISQIVQIGDDGVFIVLDTNVCKDTSQRIRNNSGESVDMVTSTNPTDNEGGGTISRKPLPFANSYPSWVLKEANSISGHQTESRNGDITRQELIEELKKQNLELQGEVNRLRYRSKNKKLLGCC